MNRSMITAQRYNKIVTRNSSFFKRAYEIEDHFSIPLPFNLANDSRIAPQARTRSESVVLGRSNNNSFTTRYGRKSSKPKRLGY